MFWRFTVPYCPFFGHIESYLGRKENRNLLIVRYEDLIKDPSDVIRVITFIYLKVTCGYKYYNYFEFFRKLVYFLKSLWMKMR